MNIGKIHVPLALFAVLATSGCSLSADPEGAKTGELGNGGFLFSCDDAVACTPYADDAKKFPSAVSLSSTFTVRFVPKSTGLNIHFNDSAPERGITIEPLADYVSKGPSGLVAVKGGYATISARDAAGQLIDYTVLRVAKPDTIIIYNDAEPEAAPMPVGSTVTLDLGDTKVFRAFAQQNKENLAGRLQIEWTSSDQSVVEVQSNTNGKATLVARASGTAKLSAVGGTFTQQVPVTVK